MTKLLEWLFGISLFLAAWLSLLTGQISNRTVQDWRGAILYAPVIAIIIFGIYSVIVVLWRVYCFNDCAEAAEELKEQISQAKEDLRKKGLKI